MLDLKSYIQEHKERLLNELFELLKIASISANPAYDTEVTKGAQAVHDFLKAAGIDHTKIYKTEGHPIVYGEKNIAPHLPTVLVYGQL